MPMLLLLLSTLCHMSGFIPLTLDSSSFSWLLLSAHMKMGTQNCTPVVPWKQLLISNRLDVDILLNCLLAAVTEFWGIFHERRCCCPALLGLLVFQTKNLLFTLRPLLWDLNLTCYLQYMEVFSPHNLIPTGRKTLLVLEKKCSILVPFLICIIAPCNRAKTLTGLGWWLKGY